jgi:branched-subunit amino acid transport protein
MPRTKKMELNVTDWSTMLIIAGLACVTVITRSLFFISSKPWTLPHWVQRGLQYAPLAALSAVIVPEIFMAQGQLIGTWQDARWMAALAGAIWFYFRRGVLGTIVTGMAVYLPLHIGWGW